MTFVKLNEFSKKVADLPDRPTQYTSEEIKNYFDSSPEELRVAFNNFIDQLSSVAKDNSGAKNIGVAPFSNSPSNLQGVLEWLKESINTMVLGQIPDSSITKVKLEQSIVNDLEKALTISDRNDGTKPLKVEVRTSDPTSPEIGHIWLRSDL